MFQLSRNLALVLLHDLLYGKGIQCGGPLKFLVKRHRADLICSLKTIRQDEDDSQSCKCSTCTVYMYMYIVFVQVEMYMFKQNGAVFVGCGGDKLLITVRSL